MRNQLIDFLVTQAEEKKEAGTRKTRSSSSNLNLFPVLRHSAV